MQSLKNSIPTFFGERAADQQVSNCFRSLTAKGAAIIILQIVSLSSSSRPATIMEHKPTKEFAFTWGLSLFQDCSSWYGVLANEKSPIS